MNTTLTLIDIFEYLGIFAFAISGAMLGIKKRIDLFGVIFIGVTTALGGGVIRDVLTGRLPPVMFVNRVNVLIAVCASVATFLIAFHYKQENLFDHEIIHRIINMVDALGLGVFTVTGINMAIEGGYSQNFLFAIFIGMTTGVGGGMLRDIMLMEIPFVLRKQIYAVASLIGGTVYYILYTNYVNRSFCIFFSVSMIVLIRLFATIYHWRLPKAY